MVYQSSLVNSTAFSISGYDASEEFSPVELLPGSSSEDVDLVIRLVYRQVLGNAHIMESERLTIQESKLKQGTVSVREFVRQVAKSELYRSRFFENCPRYRSIELNFKHLLGRAPNDYSETFTHSQILDTEGIEAEIDSYINSNEYSETFGENIVPFNRGNQTLTGKKLLGFCSSKKINKGVATSDQSGKEGNQSRLTKVLIHNTPSGSLPVTNIQQLLERTFRPKTSVSNTVPKPNQAPFKSESELQALKYQQQVQIEDLKKQLAQLQTFSNIGETILNKWQKGLPNSSGQTSSLKKINSSFLQAQTKLEREVQEQEEMINCLQTEVADKRRLTTIALARLNKWRSRTFSI